MAGATDLPQRSSSPLKRRASSMEPDTDNGGRDAVDMVSVSQRNTSVPAVASTCKGAPQDDRAGNEKEKQGFTTVSLRGGERSDMLVSSAVFALKEGKPSAEEQVKTIKALHRASEQTPLQEDDEFFLVSRLWLISFLVSGGDIVLKKSASEGPISPIDNSDIILSHVKDVEGERAVRLKPDMVLGEHFEMLPPSAWNLLVEWYGLTTGQIPIRRVAHNTAPTGAKNIQVELHPPVFTLHRISLPATLANKAGEMASSTTGFHHHTTPAPLIQCSSSYRFQHFWRAAKLAAGVPLTVQTRLWHIHPSLDISRDNAPVLCAKQNLDPNLTTPPDTPDHMEEGPDDNFHNLFIHSADFLALDPVTERTLVDFRDLSNDENYNGSMTLEFVSFTTDKHILLDESVDDTKWVSTFRFDLARGNPTRASTSPRPRRAQVTSLPPSRPKPSTPSAEKKPPSSGRSSPGPRGPVTRGRAKRSSGRTIGCVGLNNLGNSCYMNSALQCIRSVEELTKYFLVRESDSEINRDNPLGYNGETAIAYGHLLREIYQEPAPSSIAPRSFKNVIGRYNPTFSGYGQQDSQEFVNFLLDGLREDLNRIKQKPYIEVPDSTDEMIGNPAAIRALGEKVWDIGKQRDDSVIHDLFTGMYRSSLVCPVCSKVSLVFETFNSLTLPLPIKGVWSREVKYFPLNDHPVYLDIEVDRDETLGGLKKFVSGRVGVSVERLMVAEVWKEKFFKFYDDDSSVSEEIASNDFIHIYELDAKPSSSKLGDGKKSNVIFPSSMLDVETPAKNGDDTSALDKAFTSPENCFVVPIYHRLDPGESGRILQNKPLPPHFICVTPTEAYNVDAVRRKVLEKVATFSKWAKFAQADEDCADDETDPVMVATASSDADSTGDGRKVVARSVESEEDIVDVTMGDSTQPGSSSSNPKYPHLLRNFNSRRPRWVDPNQYLSGELQNLFSMGYFSAKSSPSSWPTIDNFMPTLESRMPEPVTPALSDIDMRSPGHQNDDSDTSQEDIPAEPAQELTRMAEESDEDDDMPPIQYLAQRARPAIRAGGGARRGGKTYGKKGRARRRGGLMHSKASIHKRSIEADSSPAPPSEDFDGGPLIRPGEGIMINWKPNIWDTVFAAENITHDASEMELLQDCELIEKRKARNLRKKNGVSLNDCLDSFEKEETLSESNEWYCPRCKEHRQAKKKMVLWKTPDILVIHLKRFSSAGYRRDKLDMLVNFPVDGLNITHRLDETSAKRNNEIYDLIAVDDHWGGLNGGHYTAYAKNFVDNEWYDFNDSSVSKVDDMRKLVSPSAYLLFYRRRSDEPLGGERYKEILAKFDARYTQDDDVMSDSARDPLGPGSPAGDRSSPSKGKGVAQPRGAQSLTFGPEPRSLSVDANPDDSPPAYHQIDGTSDEAIELEDDVLPGQRRGLGYGNGNGSSSDFIQPSIEQDEGSPWGTGVGWSFGALNSGQAGTAEGSEATNVDSLDPGLGEPGDRDLTMTSEIQFPDYGNAGEEVPPPPAGLMEEISNKAWANKNLHEIPVADMNVDQDSDKVVSIRVEDDTEQMD